MAERVLMKGNEAVAEAAIRAGCRLYFAYPITPQNELVAYMARMMPLEHVKGQFVQAESEVAAINMVYGAAGVGMRVLTSSSSPGMSLKMEGISYLAGANLPAVIVNVQRGGPGLGDIQPAQGDYFQCTRGGGHGDYQTITLAPASVQEFADLAFDAFDLADKYRTPVILLADGLLAQMMEPVAFKPYKTSGELAALKKQHTSWCVHENVDGPNRHHHEINSLELDPEVLSKHVLKLQEKYKLIEREEIRVEEYNINPDNEMVCVSFGTSARIVKEAIDVLNKEGRNIGLIRPITVWPYPYATIRKALGKKVKNVNVFELNLGQMLEDVKLAVAEKVPVNFKGKVGGLIFTPEEIVEDIRKYL